MSSDIEVPREPTAASLVSGNLGDLQHLVEQQFRLTRQEIEDELRQRAAAAAIFVVGIGIGLVDAIVLCLSLAHLSHRAKSPQFTHLARLPFWDCYAVLAAMLTFVGGNLSQLGRNRFHSITPSLNPASEMPQERAPWKIPPK